VAKKAKDTMEATEATNGPEGSVSSSENSSEGESIAGYFRKVFKEKPRLLKERSNAELVRSLAQGPSWPRHGSGRMSGPDCRTSKASCASNCG